MFIVCKSGIVPKYPNLDHIDIHLFIYSAILCEILAE